MFAVLYVINLGVFIICLISYIFKKKPANPDIGIQFISELMRTWYIWCIFWIGLEIEMIIDNQIRIDPANIIGTGIPENIWHFIQYVLAVITIGVVYRRISKGKTIIYKLLLITIQMLINGFAYFIATIAYVLLTGIDSK